MPELLVESEALQGGSYPFHGDAVIGRSPEADLRLMDFTISRSHAKLIWGDKAYLVEDLGSSNGTFVNGKPVVGPTAIGDGDAIQLGRVLLRFSWPAGEQGLLAAGGRVRFDERAKPARVEQVDASAAVALLADEGGDQSEALTQRLELLFEVTRAIGGTLDEDELLALILRKLFDILPQAERGIVLLLDEGGKRLVPRVATSRSGAPTEMAVSRTLLNEVVETNSGILCADAREDARFSDSRTVHRHQIQSVICVPVRVEQQTFGVLQLDGSRSGPVFSRQDMALATGVANQAGLFLANARLHQRLVQQRLLEKDLDLASKIQHHFLPEEPPRVESYEFSVEYQPALGIGGDYYDFLELVDGRIGVVVGDVSGKGISAALYMTKLSSEVRYRSAGIADPAEILRRVNAALSTSVEEGMFVTLTIVALDPASGVLEVANAGHPPPLLCRRRGVERLAETPDAALGLDRETRFSNQRRVLEPGDSILIYTDGVTESAGAEGFYGERRLRSALASATGGPRALIEAVMTSLSQFSAGAPPADDLTLLGLGRRG